MITSRTLSPLDYQLQLPNRRKILAIYALTLLMYTAASPDPDTDSDTDIESLFPYFTPERFKTQAAQRKDNS